MRFGAILEKSSLHQPPPIYMCTFIFEEILWEICEHGACLERKFGMIQSTQNFIPKKKSVRPFSILANRVVRWEAKRTSQIFQAMNIVLTFSLVGRCPCNLCNFDDIDYGLQGTCLQPSSVKFIVHFPEYPPSFLWTNQWTPLKKNHKNWS